MTESAVQNHASAASRGAASAPAGLPLRWVVILALATAGGLIALFAGAPVWAAMGLGVSATVGLHKVVGS